MRTIVASVLISLALAHARIAGAGAHECLVGFDGVGARDGGKVTRLACDGACLFDVAVCVGSRACEAAPVDALRVETRPGSHLQGPEDGGVCGDRMRMRLVPHRRRAARFSARVRAHGRAGRRDRDRLVLRCLPNPENVGCETTTIETPPSTTTTTSPWTCVDWSTAALGRLTDFPPSLPTPGTCADGDPGSNYTTPDAALDPAATEELHVLTVYEGIRPRTFPAFDEHQQGDVTVHVTARPKPVALVLSSYEPVRWTIVAAPGAAVSRVVARSYYPDDTEVAGLGDAVPVRVEEIGGCGGIAYGWEIGHGGGVGYRNLIVDARNAVALTESSFQGCYTGRDFQLPYTTDPPPPPPAPVEGDESIANADVAFPACAAVTAESAYCLTAVANGGSLAVLGLDTGTVCRLGIATGAEPALLLGPSLGWHGEIAYACGDDGLVRISLRDGRAETPQVACAGAAADASGLHLMQGSSGGAIFSYDDYAAVLAGTPAATHETWNTRFTAHDGRFLTAWHSTNTIDVIDVASDVTTPLLLEGYDGWILGMSATDDGALVIAGDLWGDTVRIFDRATGAILCDVHPAEPVTGLACVSRRETPRVCPVATTTTVVTTSTTTTTFPYGVCEPTEPTCCSGGTGTGPCWESAALSTEVLILCTIGGGVLTDGPCPDTCGERSACCRVNGCNGFEVLGDFTDGFDGSICSFVANGTYEPNACNATGAACRRTGCSGQVCDDHDVATTCEWLPEYACYATAQCGRQPFGACGWTPTPELANCLANGAPTYAPPTPD